MPRQLGIKEAKQRAGRFCAVRERSPNELFEKIQSYGLGKEDAASLVQLLMAEGYVDEQRFANAYCHDKFEFNSWGKLKIRASVYKHKLSEEVLRNALDALDPEKYEARLETLAESKWKKLAEEDSIKRKQKTVAYLANKGFEADLIWKVIAQLESGRSA